MKVKAKVNGEPVRGLGDYPLATRLVENNNCNPLGRSSWFALAAPFGYLLRALSRSNGLAGSLLRLFHRPKGRRTGPKHGSGMGLMPGRLHRSAGGPPLNGRLSTAYAPGRLRSGSGQPGAKRLRSRCEPRVMRVSSTCGAAAGKGGLSHG